MNYPSGQVYEALYAKYIHKRPVSELVDYAGKLQGKACLDLCCGTGKLTKECVLRGATCDGVDISREMMDRLDIWLAANPPCSSSFVKDVESYLRYCFVSKVSYDVVFCRQAVNYWLNEMTANFVRQVLNPGGMFIFNTFSKEPSTVPATKSYHFQGHHFVETSWLVGDMVHHVQIRDGLPPHTTSFRWIPPEEYNELLEGFGVSVDHDGPTSIYVCTVKG